MQTGPWESRLAKLGWHGLRAGGRRLFGEAAAEASEQVAKEEAAALLAKEGAQFAAEVAPISGAAQLEGRFAIKAGRSKRTVDEAIALARQQGIHIGEDIRIVPVTRVDILGTGNRAEYFFLAGEHVRPGQMFSWSDLLVNGQVPMRMRRGLLISDEAIVATLGHEMHEINALRVLFQENGQLSAETLRRLLNAPNGILHQEALQVEHQLLKTLRRAD